MHAIQPAPAAPAPALPSSQQSATAFVMDMQVGPQGVQYMALRSLGGTVLARSGWHADAGVAWAALGSKLAPMLLRCANRAAS